MLVWNSSGRNSVELSRCHLPMSTPISISQLDTHAIFSHFHCLLVNVFLLRYFVVTVKIIIYGASANTLKL